MMMILGDSKSNISDASLKNVWPVVLMALLNHPNVMQSFFAALGQSGATVGTFDVSTAIATGNSIRDTNSPGPVLCNLGANDMAAMPSKSAFETAYLAILDAVHIAWPLSLVYIAKPWRGSHDADADTLAGWVDEIVEARSSFARLGHDERVWGKYSDDGNTHFIPATRLHYSGAGQMQCAFQWRAILT